MKDLIQFVSTNEKAESHTRPYVNDLFQPLIEVLRNAIQPQIALKVRNKVTFLWDFPTSSFIKLDKLTAWSRQDR